MSMHLIYITLLVVVQVQFSLQNLQSENHNRIYKGSIAEPHSAPYQVGLYVIKKIDSRWCSGSLIKPKFVLTTAHCLVNALSARVIIGTNYLNDTSKTSVEAINFKKHARYNPYTLENDISIVKLMRPVRLSNEVAFIRLPTNPDRSSFVGKYGILTGWGRTADWPNQMSLILKKLKVRLVNIQECRVFKNVIVDSTKLCGYGERGGSFCPGDTGSPLVLENTNIQIGIGSFLSANGCTVGYPHGYTNVASYLDWISKWSRKL